MATFFDLRRVQVLCSCNRSCPLSQLYFCRHCLDVRCGNCVSHEVDSNYCPNCLENMASAEAKMRKHRCGNCYDCPTCGRTLSTRATLALVNAEGKQPNSSSSTTQKTYYLVCPFCHWSTRDTPNISDQKTPAGAWIETPNPHAQRIEELVTAYRQLAVKEKNDSQRNKYVRKRNYMMFMLSLQSRYPILTPRLRRYRSSGFGPYGKETEPTPDIHIPGCQAEPVTESFNVEDLIKTPFSFEKKTSMYQRCLMPITQEPDVTNLEPHHMSLAVKRSLRCRKCEHNLSKADFNPSAIKFRINLSAYNHIPDIRFALAPDSVEKPAPSLSAPKSYKPQSDMTAMCLAASSRLPILTFASVPAQPLMLQNFVPDKATKVIFTICNPAHTITTVSLRQLTPEEEASKLAAFLAASPSQATTLQPLDGEKEGQTTPAPIFSTVKLTLPSYGIRVAAKNNVTEYDDFNVDTSDEFPGDDKECIAFRRGNKVGINVGVTLKQGMTHLRAAVNVSFDYKKVTNAILSEQRASTASAVLSASGIRDNNNGGGGDAEVTTPVPVPPSNLDDLQQIDVIFLIDFGQQGAQ